MTNPSSCDVLPPSTLTVAQAQARILAALQGVKETEYLPLEQALGRVLAEAIKAPFNVPPHRNSAMDGYALNSTSLTEGVNRLTVVGKSLAGHPFKEKVGLGECVRITTGAVVPDGANTILIQEDITRFDNIIEYIGTTKPDKHIRYPGEDLAQGAEVLSVGRVLNAADLGLIASLGIGHVSVWRKVKVAIMSTGDEVQAIGKPLSTGQIYDSNRYTLKGLLQRLEVEVIDFGIVPDEPSTLEQAFLSATAQADVLITSGGVSVGDADYITQILERLGQIDFWKIAMKPGKPLAFGRLGNCAFFGLPGNPVSTMVTFIIFVRSALLKLGNYPVKPVVSYSAKCLTDLYKAPGRQEYQRGIAEQDEYGQWTVRNTGIQESHVLHSMSVANCFMVLAQEWGDVEQGTEIPIIPFAGLF